MAKEKQCLEALATARALVVSRAPYFAKTLYGLVPVLAPIGTLGVSKSMVLTVDPEWYTKHNAEEAAGLLVHECMHILRDVARLDALPDHYQANLAGDIAINQDLRNAGWQLPAGGAYPEQYGFPTNLSLEQYYDLLETRAKKSKKGEGTAGAAKDGDTKDGEGHGKPQVTNGQCGSCAGNPHAGEGTSQEAKEHGRAPADVLRIKKETAKDVKKATSTLTASNRGYMPAGLEDLVDFEEQPSIIPWRTKLGRVVRRTSGRAIAGTRDYSFRRPAKRSYFTGILRPGMIDRKIEICLIRDTSGSMGDVQINSVNSEIIAILKQLGVERAWLLDADAEVACEPRRVSVHEVPDLKLYGRGGTSFKPAIAAALKLRPKPDVIIYLTDGDGDAPATPPVGTEVVWCVVPSGWGRKPADWGHLVVVSDDLKLREPYNQVD
jgi:predicted metal-dependent peptidase